ncbi:MAG TPA: flagellar basal-body MS-ring/collar protein FliF [Terriglobales bacterium]|nr:flagellar basal-body MS-ring/collar protein FliF [Terriglobales bacterium]
MLGQLKNMLSGLSAKQRVVLAASALLTVATVALFVSWIGKPEYKTLYTNMEPADAQSLVSRLAEKNIPTQVSPDGKTVSVPEDKLDASRLELASQGMPHSGRMGFELFDKMNWGETEFDEKVNYQRALEGELERTIQTLHGVESARVHLVMPSDSVFVDRDRDAKASVILTMHSGEITPDMQMAIARLVSGAVDRLRPENVAIVDANNNQPAGLPQHDPLSPAGGLEKELSARLIETLAPVVGADHVRASVNVEYDPSTSEENQETYDPKSAVAVSTQRSDEQVGGGAPGSGVPGTSSNVPGGDGKATNAKQTADADTDSDADDSQVSHSESSTYVVSKMTRRTVEPAGRIRRISAALVVDDAIEVKQSNGKRTEVRRKRTPEELKQISDLATAALGLDTSRGDVIAVQNIAFHEAAPEEGGPTVRNITERVRGILTDWSSVVRYAALLLLFLLAYFLLLRPVKKQVITTFRELPQHLSATDKPQNQLADSEFSGQRALVLKKQLVEKVKAEPVSAGRLVQAWLREGGQ